MFVLESHVATPLPSLVHTVHILYSYTRVLHLLEHFLVQEFAELLVMKGASASHRDSAGASVLVHAAHARMPKVVKALLSGAEGMDKDSASDEGVTALIAAAMKVFCNAPLGRYGNFVKSVPGSCFDSPPEIRDSSVISPSCLKGCGCLFLSRRVFT